jgi:hypothetical protein
MIRTHVKVVRDGVEYEWDDDMLPMLSIGHIVSVPGAEKAVVKSVEIDLTNEFPIQWVEAD